MSAIKDINNGKETVTYQISDNQQVILDKLLRGDITTREYVAKLMKQQKEK